MASKQVYVSTMTIENLTDKCMLHMLSFLPPKEILKCRYVTRKWRKFCDDPNLWTLVSFRPNYDGLQVTNHDVVYHMIGTRLSNVKSLDLNTDLITPHMLQEFGNRCPHLRYLTLDFSTAAQLHDFTDLQSFPSRLKSLCLCLSENIFLEGFLRKIYTFISSVEVLTLFGTYEKIEDEEEEVYETVNIHKLTVQMPNLRIVNLWGVLFVSDEHVDGVTANCAKLECLVLNYCTKITGTCVRNIVNRCRNLKSLLCAHTSLNSQLIAEIEWEKMGGQLEELDISGTELNQSALMNMLCRLPALKWLKASFLESFTDEVMYAWLESGATANMRCLDLDTCDLISADSISEFLARNGKHMRALNLAGHPKLNENFWMLNFERITNVEILCMGMPEDCCPKVISKIHVDQFIDKLANNCNKLRRFEVRWDDETLRFSEKSSKFIDVLRLKCPKLHSMVLSDGSYYELVRANCERAGRMCVVRTTEMAKTSMFECLKNYYELLFN